MNYKQLFLSRFVIKPLNRLVWTAKDPYFAQMYGYTEPFLPLNPYNLTFVPKHEVVPIATDIRELSISSACERDALTELLFKIPYQLTPLRYEEYQYLKMTLPRSYLWSSNILHLAPGAHEPPVAPGSTRQDFW